VHLGPCENLLQTLSQNIRSMFQRILMQDCQTLLENKRQNRCKHSSKNIWHLKKSMFITAGATQNISSWLLISQGYKPRSINSNDVGFGGT
jgi:hypothetical protein